MSTDHCVPMRWWAVRSLRTRRHSHGLPCSLAQKSDILYRVLQHIVHSAPAEPDRAWPGSIWRSLPAKVGRKSFFYSLHQHALDLALHLFAVGDSAYLAARIASRRVHCPTPRRWIVLLDCGWCVVLLVFTESRRAPGRMIGRINKKKGSKISCS